MKKLPQIGSEISRWSLKPRKRYKRDGEINDRVSRVPNWKDANAQGQVDMKFKQKRNCIGTGIAVTLYTIRNGWKKNYTVRRVRKFWMSERVGDVASFPEFDEVSRYGSNKAYTLLNIHD